MIDSGEACTSNLTLSPVDGAVSSVGSDMQSKVTKDNKQGCLQKSLVFSEVSVVAMSVSSGNRML
jgi:hypothetical protein